jgi:hypothetical protein
MPDDPQRRCGTCARFVRVVETIDDTGEVRRHGECLLGVWPSPLYDTSTCSQWVRRGEFKARPPERPTRARSATPRSTGSPRTSGPAPGGGVHVPIVLPEDLLDMDAEEFRRVLAEVIRDELGVGDAEIAGRWEGGEMILKPGKPGLQEKRVPVESIFNKVVMIRDKLRLLEQKINSHPKLAPEEKVQLQQYITGCYGSLTTFNVLFSNRDDQFVGQKGDE